ncbi:MerR family transcriptional regulator [Amycolatopsis vancoresmycina]|uniref:MerR family transcriptional regulator n=1 Tax=Amycolatopsis vancoresmycina DSM 44592 TaxID=1292037 RepID=R1GCD1_9PSEU|nr:MerR family transcriptional regulator [Amycolatopsis vancoresmycina]EOD68987.1 MerR family transcriptional regulator [Amycolatopsis vancoresmycina DSM 44592]
MDRPAPAPAGTWTAGAVARMLGLPASTLRAWHRRYGLPLSAPQPGSHRRYGRADVDALLRMKHLIEQGFSAETAAARAFHPDSGTDVGTLLTAVRRLKLDTAVALLDAHLPARGVTGTWDGLCRPALDALCGPDAGCIDLVHGLSWAIAAALHRIPAPAGTAPPVLLSCVDGERHTLPLEALRAALAEEGRAALFLGASVPEIALRHAIDRVRPDAVVLWSTHPAAPPSGLRTRRLVVAGPGRPPDSLREAVSLLTAAD